MHADDRPVAVDLFAGAGGLALGFEQAGFDVVAAFDNDPVHAAVHAYNFPTTEVRCRDLVAVGADEVLEAADEGVRRHRGSAAEWSGQVDAIIGGPPCQGFSTMGKRELEDERNELVFDFARIVESIRPRYFLMENVPGLIAGKYGSLLEELIEELEAAGYKTLEPVKVLNAAEYGVPQDRERLILIGSLQGEPSPKYPDPTVRPVPKRAQQRDLFDDSSENGSLPRGPTVGEAIGDLPDLDRFAELSDTDEVRLSEETRRRMVEKASRYALRLQGKVPDPEDLSYRREYDPTLLTSSKRTDHMDKSVRRFSETEPGETEPVSRFYRLDPDGLCNTLRAGTGSSRGAFTAARPIHPTRPRVISVREAARLHTYPDWFRFHETKWHGFRQVGNSVPPMLAQALGKKLVKAMGLDPEVPDETVALGKDSLLRLSKSQAAEHFEADSAEIPAPRQRA